MPRKEVTSASIGKTTTGGDVISGAFVFNFSATHGLPLSFQLIRLQELGLTVDWLGYVQAAIQSGRKFNRVLATIEEETLDVYDTECRTAILTKLTEMKSLCTK